MRYLKYYRLTLLTVLLIIVEATKLPGQGKIEVGSKAPSLHVQKWVKGSPVTKFRKKHVYVIEFGATHCAPCRQIAPHLTALSKQYAGKATFISMHIWENDKGKTGDTSYVKNVENYVTAMGEKIGFSVAVDVPLQTTADTWMKGAGQTGIPTVFIVNQSGRIAWIGSPFILDSVLDQIVKGTFDPVAYKEELLRKEEKRKREQLKAGDPPPPFIVSQWLKGQGVPLDQPMKDSCKAYIVVVSNTPQEMEDRKSIHLMTKLAKEYGNNVHISWVYSVKKERAPQIHSFVEEVADNIAYHVALDTAGMHMFKKWNHAAGKHRITAYVIDRDMRIVWLGAPRHAEQVVKGVINGRGLEAGRELDKNNERIFALIHKLSDQYKKEGNRAMLARMDSIIRANPGDQYLYSLKYQYFYSHQETPAEVKEAEKWLLWMLNNMPENYMYWEEILTDALHAIHKHNHDYVDILVKMMNLMLYEAETFELETALARSKARLMADFIPKGGAGHAARFLNYFIRDHNESINSQTRALLMSEYYFYTIQSLAKNPEETNAVLEEISGSDLEGMQLHQIIDYLTGQDVKCDYNLLMKIAERYLRESHTNDAVHARALASFAKVYDFGGETEKAHKYYQEALKVSERTMKQNIIDQYKRMLTAFKESHSIH